MIVSARGQKAKAKQKANRAEPNVDSEGITQRSESERLVLHRFLNSRWGILNVVDLDVSSPIGEPIHT